MTTYEKPMIFANLFQKVFHLDCFKIMQLRQFANVLFPYYKHRKKQSDMFHFFFKCVSSFKYFFIDFIQNYGTAYDCKVRNGTANVKMSHPGREITLKFFRYSDFKYGSASVLTMHCIGVRELFDGVCYR